MNKNVLNRMMELLDIQQEHCMRAGAVISVNSFAPPKGGDKAQNAYYTGHLNMADALAMEMRKYIVKENGKHKLVDERR